MVDNYYVYVYLDPRKKGEFKYGEFKFKFEPFYVGKGKNSRMYRHLKLNEHNNLKNNKIKKIFSSGMSPIIIKIKENLSNEESLELEKTIIKSIGRKIKKNGPLLNFKDGGESYIGYKHKDEYIKNLEKPVIKYDLNGNVLGEYKSVKEAGEKNNIYPQTISQICSGEIKIFKNKFIFMYKKDEFKRRKRKKKQYTVQRIDYNLNIVEYDSLTEAANKNNLNLSKINAVCMGNRFQTGGFLWRYKSHPKKENFSNKINEKFKKYLDYMTIEIPYKDIKYKNILHIIKENDIKVNNLFHYIKKTK